MTRDASSGSSLFALRVQANVSPTYADPNVGGSVSLCGQHKSAIEINERTLGVSIN